MPETKGPGSEVEGCGGEYTLHPIGYKRGIMEEEVTQVRRIVSKHFWNPCRKCSCVGYPMRIGPYPRKFALTASESCQAKKGQGVDEGEESCSVRAVVVEILWALHGVSTPVSLQFLSCGRLQFDHRQKKFQC